LNFSELHFSTNASFTIYDNKSLTFSDTRQFLGYHFAM
jgi:hypothetical protein